MPSAQHGAAATPASIDTMFAALLQQMTDTVKPNGAALIATASQAQTTDQTAVAGSNANAMALIQNPATLDASNGVLTTDSTVAAMPAASIGPDALSDGTQSDIAALLAHFSSQNNGAVAAKTDKTSNNPISQGLMQPTTASAAASAASASAAATAAQASVPSDKTASDDSGPPVQTTSDGAPYNTLAALFAAQWTASQQAPMQQPAAQTTVQTPAVAGPEPLATNSAATATPPASQATASQTTAGQTTADQPVIAGAMPPSLPQQILASQNPPVVTPKPLAAAPQATMAATQDAQAAGPSAQSDTPTASVQAVAPQPVETVPNQAASDQAVSDQAASDQAVSDQAVSDQAARDSRTSDNAAAASNGAAAQAQAPVAPTTDQSTAQSMMAAPVTTVPMAPVTAAANPIAAKAAAQVAAQVSDQASVPTAAGKPDAKAKAAPSAKAHAASDKPSENGLAATPMGDDRPAAAQPTTTNDAKPVPPAPVHAAPVHTDKPAADANTGPPTASPLAPVVSGGVAAKIEVTAQKSDSDAATPFDKLGLTIAARSAEGLHHFDIRLDPADLGKVQVRLTVDDKGQAQATLVADKQQTLDLLQRDSSSLNRALQDAGLNLSNNGLNFSLREQYQQNETGGQARRRSLSAAAILATEASQSRSSQGSYAPHSVRLDIRV